MSTLPQTKPQTKPQTTQKTSAYFLAFIALGLSGAIVGPTLPALAERAQATTGEISAILALSPLGFLIGSFFAGRAYDRLSGHMLMAGGLALIAVGLFVITQISPLWLLLIIFVMIGVAQSLIDVGGNNMIVWVHGEGVTPYINGLHFCFGLGSSIAPLIVAQMLILAGDPLLAYAVLGILIVPIIPWLLRLNSPRPQHDQKAKDGQMQSLGLILVVCAFFFVYVGVEVGYSSWVYTYATELELADETAAAYLNSAFWGLLTVGRLVAVPLATRLRARTILLIDLLGCMVSIGLIVLVPTPLALWIGTLGGGFFMASIFPTAFAFAQRKLDLTASVNSWFFIAAGLGSMIIPWGIGQVFDRGGTAFLPHIIFINILITFVLYWVIVRFDR